jgi:hypothetical protein
MPGASLKISRLNIFWDLDHITTSSRSCIQGSAFLRSWNVKQLPQLPFMNLWPRFPIKEGAAEEGLLEMPDPLDFDAHATPPQELKILFKSWKGQLTTERDRNLNETLFKMLRLDSIPNHRLDEIFNTFSDDGKDSGAAEQVALGLTGSVYGSQNVPGMLAMFISYNR